MALLASFVAVPALAYAITSIFSIGEQREIGLILVATAAGAPFLIKLVQISGSDLAVASGLLVLLIVASIVYMPLVVPDADISAISIATPLVMTMLLPLVVGLILDEIIPSWTTRLQPHLGIVANVALITLVLSTVIANFGELVDVFGTGSILAALLFIAGAFGIGYLMGTPFGSLRDEMALATAQRNIAAATVVATQSIAEPETTVMVIVTSLAAMALLFPTARFMSRRTNAEAVQSTG